MSLYSNPGEIREVTLELNCRSWPILGAAKSEDSELNFPA